MSEKVWRAGTPGRGRVAPEAVVGAPVVRADPADQLDLRDGRIDVLDEEADDLLLAPRHPGAREGARHVDALVGLAVDPPEVGAREQAVRAERAAPLERGAHRRRRHPLIEGQGLRVPVGGLGGEGAAEGLKIGEDGAGPLTAVARACAHPGREGARVGVVDLKRGAVVAALLVVGAAHEHGQIGGGHHLHAPVEGGVGRARVPVDGASARGVHDLVAVGGEVVALQAQAEGALGFGQEQIHVVRVVVAVAAFEEGGPLEGTPRDDVDDPAEGVVAPHACAPAAHDLHLLHALQGDAVPVHPAAERVVDGNAVEQHEGTAGPARADAAQ